MARKIDYFFSLVSPWAYLGHAAFEKLAQEHGAAIDYHPVNLGEVFRETGGLPLPKRHPARQHYRFVELQRWRERRGLPLNLRPAGWPLPPDLPDRAIIALTGAGRDPSPFMRRVFLAIWHQQRRLSDEAELAQLLTESGEEAETILEAARSSESEAAYRMNREAAIEAGVFGAPSYVLDGEVFWGQDRLDLLADALSSGRPPYRGGD